MIYQWLCIDEVHSLGVRFYGLILYKDIGSLLMSVVHPYIGYSKDSLICGLFYRYLAFTSKTKFVPLQSNFRYGIYEYSKAD